MPDFLDPKHLVEAFGLIGIGVIVFAESGLLIGFFLPGDSLLFAAGLFASQGRVNFPVLLTVIFVAAVTGDSVGYAFGKRAGLALYKRRDSRFFKHEHLMKATTFYERHGGKTIVIARFVPIVRTFAPIVAGATEMEYRRFLTFNVLGAGIWGIGVTTAGYLLGTAFPWVGENLEYVIAVIIVLSVIPIAIHALRERRTHKREAIIRARASSDGTVDSGDDEAFPTKVAGISTQPMSTREDKADQLN